MQKKISFPRKFDGSVYLNSDGNMNAVSTKSADTEQLKINKRPKDDTSDEDKTTKAKSTTNDKDTNEEDQVDDEPLEYELYSMMIHTGGASGGHYFAYLRILNLEIG